MAGVDSVLTQRAGECAPLDRCHAKRVLFYTEGWGNGGIESLLMSMFGTKAWADSGYAFDLFNVCDWSTGYDSRIVDLGGRRFVCFPNARPGLLKRFAQGLKGFDALLRENEYAIVHVNATNSLNFAYADLARRRQVPIRVMHSHNSHFDNCNDKVLLKRVGQTFGKLAWSKSATVCMACSEAAGRFVFGSNGYDVEPNAIDCSVFAFSDEGRRRVRQELGIPDGALLLGSIGRVDARKNPLFQLRVFAEAKGSSAGCVGEFQK